MNDLTNSVTVITGGGQGIGLGLGLEAAKRGSRVLIAERSDASDAVERIRSAGGEAEWFQVDVADRDKVTDLAAFARERFGAVNIVVNNAASGNPAGAITDIDADELRQIIDVNVLGYVWMIQAFAEDLRRSAASGRPAYILNVGSEHSLGVPPHVAPISAYTLSKQAEFAISEVTRRDLGGDGVAVSTLAPSWVHTEQIRDLIAASPDFASAVTPYLQETADVARIAFDGLLAGRELILTNPASVDFARRRAERIIADAMEAKQLEEQTAWVHDGSGDISKCPVAPNLPNL
jgi:NAD(P)-dependent dehydrogenase (short-subunit alcohol dehydrogenase family)